MSTRQWKKTQIVGEQAGWWSRDAPTVKTGTKAEEVVVFPDIKTTRKDAEDVPAVWVFCSQLWCCIVSKQFNKSWWIPPGSGPVSERSNNNQQLFCPEPAESVSTVVTSAGRFLPPSRSSPLTDDLTTSRSTRSASSITLIASLIRSVLPSRFRTAALSSLLLLFLFSASLSSPVSSFLSPSLLIHSLCSSKWIIPHKAETSSFLEMFLKHVLHKWRSAGSFHSFQGAQQLKSFFREVLFVNDVNE